MLYDLNHTTHHLRMDDLRREADHERLVRRAREDSREPGRGFRSLFGRGRHGRRGEGTAWVRAA
ncbi:hypothetical protein MMF93_24025 [Streptomyces tubbatahanensis]|uniref:Uncharacterized protein n=1 Tax=Streptomyces tubbatahanensis TaxID=2923272 RepID=A0ABY3XXU0_9ACTN|nr:hypothetical protein [Streptomyces tubbatahanensis]UNS99185.1 hypothetical protein MMF93_24025 [Streptomyces tubbatahanensis]